MLSVAHFDVVRVAQLPASDRARIFPVDSLPALTYAHAAIISYAVEALREDYRRMPDPAGLLDQPFTMRELRTVHESIAGERLLPDSFRRSMLTQLTATGGYARAGRGRPAELYRRVADVDSAASS